MNALKNWLTIVLALFSLVVSGYVGYSNNDKATAVKVASLETQQVNDQATLKRLEDKIDKLDTKTDTQFDSLRSLILQYNQRREGWTYTPPRNSSK